MAGDKSQGELDVYFQSRRFRKRLNEIRKLSDDPTDLKVYAYSVARKLGLLSRHVGVIYYYLKTGTYKPTATSPSQILIVDKTRRVVPLTTHPELTFDENAFIQNVGVCLELDETTTQEELRDFVDNPKNWAVIKHALNANYPKRKKRFMPVLRIDDYLAIADGLNAVPITNRKERSLLASDLAAKYRMNRTDVYSKAKEYKSILVELEEPK